MAVTWLLLFVTICCEVVATLSLRASEGFSKPIWAIPVVIGYVMCFYLLSVVLERGMPTALAYGVWSCVGIILTAFAARVLFHDPLNWKMLLGMAIMIVGIVVMQWGTHAAA
ncbi:DMT family transporter [Bifidobacterium biavatii]|uniref:Multidrug-transport integral membrane protein Mmr n=1 Tax=Bifidobacterium biavatii DSM 23969 TaxID=1437608 RepID=A0A087A0G4_9BIFI|nr:SMR family transporter [Bifidobacterium biavatii]KFI52264.1 multidrug-transport integral membrane protein Mmr [Bifidobacterium biavatii DSM 23969]